MNKKNSFLLKESLPDTFKLLPKAIEFVTSWSCIRLNLPNTPVVILPKTVPKLASLSQFRSKYFELVSKSLLLKVVLKFKAKAFFI